MTTRISLHFLMLAIAVLISACGNSLPFDVSLEPTDIPRNTTSDGFTLASFTRQVSDDGANVRLRGPVSQPFFAVNGYVVDIEGESVQVYEYQGVDEARAAANGVTPDGSRVATGEASTAVDWISTPHFYHRDRLIVVYVGQDDGVLDALGGTLGEPFAGASKYGGPALRSER